MMMRRIGITLCSGATLLGAPAHAESVSARYDVEVLNLRVMRIDYVGDIQGKAYDLKMQAETSGMVNVFSDIKIKTNTKGTLKDGRPRPQTFELHRRKDGDDKFINLVWSKGIPSVPDNVGKDEAGRLRESFAVKSDDPMSVVLKLALHKDGDPCSGTHRIYDGRDAYDITLKSQNGSLEKGLDCAVNGKVVAGRDYEKVLKGKMKADFAYGFRLQRVATADGKSLNMPTRISGKISGRKFEANLVSLNIDGKDLVN